MMHYYKGGVASIDHISDHLHEYVRVNIYSADQLSTMIVKTLSEKHAVSVLLGIFDNGEVRKMQIMDFGPSINTIDSLLNVLSHDDLIVMREEMKGRRTFLISLSDKGKKVAEKLNKIREEFS